MDEMRENMRRANPVDDLVHRTDSPFTSFINSHPLPHKFKCLPWTHMMEHVIHVIILQPLRLQCIFRGFQMKSCVGPSLQLLKDQCGYGSTRFLPTQWVLSKN